MDGAQQQGAVRFPERPRQVRREEDAVDVERHVQLKQDLPRVIVERPADAAQAGGKRPPRIGFLPLALPLNGQRLQFFRFHIKILAPHLVPFRIRDDHRLGPAPALLVRGVRKEKGQHPGADFHLRPGRNGDGRDFPAVFLPVIGDGGLRGKAEHRTGLREQERVPVQGMENVEIHLLHGHARGVLPPFLHREERGLLPLPVRRAEGQQPYEREQRQQPKQPRCVRERFFHLCFPPFLVLKPKGRFSALVSACPIRKAFERLSALLFYLNLHEK